MIQPLEQVLQGRFIKNVFEEQGRDLLKSMDQVMRSRGFSNPAFYDRTITATEQSLIYEHSLLNRFVNMRHNTINGSRIKRRAHPVHNQILYGHANDIIYRLMYGFTQAVREEMARVDLHS